MSEISKAELQTWKPLLRKFIDLGDAQANLTDFCQRLIAAHEALQKTVEDADIPGLERDHNADLHEMLMRLIPSAMSESTNVRSAMMANVFKTQTNELWALRLVAFLAREYAQVDAPLMKAIEAWEMTRG